ncbi:MAG: hypothetical protein BWY75_01678 [bacterium ADurb.Bin425]|nr:MAG: hypothetical protein BWY75_01678 [bacterium ADurb.Bin425]
MACGIALLHPFLVVPLMLIELGHHRGSARTHFSGKAYRICLLCPVAIFTGNKVLIYCTISNTRDKSSPYSCFSRFLHLPFRGVPVVKITDNRNRLGIGSPNSEVHSFFTVYSEGMRPHLFIDAIMRALAKKMGIKI